MQSSNSNLIKVQHKNRNNYEWGHKEISDKRNKNAIQNARRKKSQRLLNE